MPLPFLTSPLLAAVAGVRHAFFTREGGVSKGIYTSLNTGPGSGDDPDAVIENRRRAAQALEVEADRLITLYQVHSAICLPVTGPWTGERPQADALATTVPGLMLGALSADCAPVLFVDPEARVIGSAHAGWKGALGGVVEATVKEMQALGAEPSRIFAAVGPCIGPKSYEVGLDFLDRFAAEDKGAERFFEAGVSADKRQFDLPAYVLHRLARAGVAQAEWIGADTRADERFFSNRRAFLNNEGDYGRLLSAIRLD
jgi:YfiH family protein